MTTPWVFLAENKKKESLLKAELETFARSLPHVFQDWKVLWVDGTFTGWHQVLQSIDRQGKQVILILDEEAELPNPQELDLVDDLVVRPFRLPELISKVKSSWTRQTVTELKREVATTYEQFTQAAEILERHIQAKSPKRFEGLRGLNIVSRHLTGLKPGGDYFDVYESDQKDFVNFLLCDSSSYGLSSALLGMLLSSSAKLASDAKMSPSHWIQVMVGELKEQLGQKEHLNLFFGRLNRRDFTLQYQLWGSIEVVLMGEGGEIQTLEKTGGRITGMGLPAEVQEKTVRLNPKDRIILMSDGFVKGVGGEFQLHQLFKKKRQQDPFQVVQELTYQIKSRLVPGETFPGEDCSAIVIDVESKILRLAPVG